MKLLEGRLATLGIVGGAAIALGGIGAGMAMSSGDDDSPGDFASATIGLGESDTTVLQAQSEEGDHASEGDNYVDTFLDAFADNLDVDRDELEEAFFDAARSVIDEAQSNGDLPDDAGDQLDGINSFDDLKDRFEDEGFGFGQFHLGGPGSCEFNGPGLDGFELPEGFDGDLQDMLDELRQRAADGDFEGFALPDFGDFDLPDFEEFHFGPGGEAFGFPGLDDLPDDARQQLEDLRKQLADGDIDGFGLSISPDGEYTFYGPDELDKLEDAEGQTYRFDFGPGRFEFHHENDDGGSSGSGSSSGLF